MANTTVGIVFEVLNRGTSGLTSIERDLTRFDSTLGGLARTASRLTTAGLIVGGLYAVERAGKALLTQAAEQEQADRSLAKSLALTNDARAETIAFLRQQAREMASVTMYSDEQIEREMAIAHHMGLATDQLVTGTKAAIGLAAALDKDLSTTMRVVTLASQGQTQHLREMGIILDKNASAQDQYNEVLRRGHSGFQAAIEDTQTLKGAAESLGQELKDLAQEAAQPLVKPAEGALNAARIYVKAVTMMLEYMNKVRAERLDVLYKGLSPEMQESFQKGYESTTGKPLKVYNRLTGVKEFEYTSATTVREREYARRLLQAYQRSPQVQESIRNPAAAGEGPTELSQVTPAQEKAREQVVRLNDALNEQVRIQYLLAKGNVQAAEEVRYQAAVQEAYAGDIETQNRLMEEYRATLASVAILEQRAKRAEDQKAFNAALEQSIVQMRQETALAGLTAREQERAVAVQNAENEALRRGVQLTAAQRAELEKVVRELQRARDLADSTFSEGWSLGIRQMQEDLLSTGQIAYELSLQMRDGIVGSINDAVFRAEDLGEALEQVGLKMLEYWMQEAMFKPLVTEGMSFGTQILGSIAGSLAASWFGGGSAGTAAGDANPAMANVAHTGGVSGVDLFPTRLVPASAFAHAPRYHTGVGPGERAAVIRDEEGIFTPGQMRALGRGLGGDRAGFGEMSGLLGQILAAVRERQTLQATLVDKRQTTQEWFESREGEQAWRYHAARNG
ncbi:MAG: phage tail tape measure protein [Phycisphaerales bacterium]